jgi:hypothetical protein
MTEKYKCLSYQRYVEKYIGGSENDFKDEICALLGYYVAPCGNIPEESRYQHRGGSLKSRR